MTTTETTMSLARDERGDLADLLATLTPEQCDSPTLCTRWRVRDVVAHVYSYEELSLARVAARMVRTRFNTDRHDGREDRPDRRHDPPARHPPPPPTPARHPRRTTHRSPRHRPHRPTLAATQRIRGLTLKATDLDWTTGDGPVIEGPGETLLMAIAGRDGITPELTGPGVSILAERIAR